MPPDVMSDRYCPGIPGWHAKWCLQDGRCNGYPCLTVSEEADEKESDASVLLGEIARIAGENELLRRVVAEQRREMDRARVVRSPLKDPTRFS